MLARATKTFVVRDVCKHHGLRHIRTSSFPPRPNGKAARFSETICAEPAFSKAYRFSDQRAAEVTLRRHMYNWRRPRSSFYAKRLLSVLSLS